MALRNGIMVHSYDHWAAAVRTPEGEVQARVGPKARSCPRCWWVRRSCAALRGWARWPTCCRRFAAGCPRRGCRSRRRAWPRRSSGRWWWARSPAARGCRGPRPKRSPSSASLLPAMAALRGSQVAGYHGAEHKAIGGYEQDTDAIDVAKEHERCGSHMVGPMLVATAIGGTHRSRACRRPSAGPRGCVSSMAAVGRCGRDVLVDEPSSREPGGAHPGAARVRAAAGRRDARADARASSRSPRPRSTRCCGSKARQADSL